MKKISYLMSIIACSTLIGCSSSDEDEYNVESYDQASNPASVYCVQQGGELEAFNDNNARVMYCVFSEDEKYEQWQYYNDNHKQNE